LPGWELRLAEAGGPEAVDEFSFVVEAIPHDLPPDLDATQRLCSQVFLLATWYLELAVVRLLGYQGEYHSRLRLGGWIHDTELVPWSTSDDQDLLLPCR
jgi:hypothetical protein